jgi:hypothetical protein
MFLIFKLSFGEGILAFFVFGYYFQTLGQFFPKSSGHPDFQPTANVIQLLRL